MKKILLVDDDVDIRKLYSIAFSEAGYEVHLAGNGNEALPEIENNNWDAILLDIQMPGLSGIEVLKKIESKDSGSISQMNIFLVTNLGKDEVIEEAHQLGVKDVFVKALYRPKDLVDMVNQYLESN